MATSPLLLRFAGARVLLPQPSSLATGCQRGLRGFSVGASFPSAYAPACSFPSSSSSSSSGLSPLSPSSSSMSPVFSKFCPSSASSSSSSSSLGSIGEGPSGDDERYCATDDFGYSLVSRARYRAKHTTKREAPPLRGIPGTPRLPLPKIGPDREIGGVREREGDCFVNRRALPLPEDPPGLRGAPRSPLTGRWRPRGAQ
mmetsp:Transcript_4745/g.11305  ORF Transcript_4745/g.11305 Transcript_4745/m.11305 type:complete len:200 (+) Transcript_4745:46-645(+)